MSIQFVRRLNQCVVTFSVSQFILMSAEAAGAPNYPPPIQMAVAHGLTVVKSFAAASALTGWVLAQDGQTSIVYTTPDGKTMLVGDLVDEHGKSLGAQYQTQHVPRPDLSVMFREFDKIDVITEGTMTAPKSTLYVFFDANCPYCHFTWQVLQPYEKAGLQVKWIPVAVLGETSLPKAVALMSAKDKTVAFRAMQEKFHAGSSLVTPPLTHPAPEIAARIQRNGVLMEKFSISGTPGVVSKDTKGNVQVKAGMPRLSELAGMTGLPEQIISNPELQRFR